MLKSRGVVAVLGFTLVVAACTGVRVREGDAGFDAGGNDDGITDDDTGKTPDDDSSGGDDDTPDDAIQDDDVDDVVAPTPTLPEDDVDDDVGDDDAPEDDDVDDDTPEVGDDDTDDDIGDDDADDDFEDDDTPEEGDDDVDDDTDDDAVTPVPTPPEDDVDDDVEDDDAPEADDDEGTDDDTDDDISDDDADDDVVPTPTPLEDDDADDDAGDDDTEVDDDADDDADDDTDDDDFEDDDTGDDDTAPDDDASVLPALIKVDGDQQSGLIGFSPNVAPAVRVTDGDLGVAGVSVSFAVEAGSGALLGPVQLTDAEGYARPGKWTLGTVPGPNVLSATVTGVDVFPQTVSFEATGVTAEFDITLRYLSEMDPTHAAAFEVARDRWEQVIIGELPNRATGNVPAGTCGGNSPAINEVIDDLLILVTVEEIDGPHGTLGQAGPCYLRSSGGLPLIGRMRFDVADLDRLGGEGLLSDVIVHEMGHVLGFNGTNWGNLDLLQNPAPPVTNDVHFSGSHARAVFDALGGSAYTGGAKVPLENCLGIIGQPCGEGTWNAHWRESVFDNELMTGYLSPAGVSNPLSRVTVASFWDLGYVVNLDGADTYSNVFNLFSSVPSSQKVELHEQPFEGSIYVIDDNGQIVNEVRVSD